MARLQKITDYAVNEIDAYGDIRNLDQYDTLAEAEAAMKDIELTGEIVRVEIEKQDKYYDNRTERLKDTVYEVLKFKGIEAKYLGLEV